MEIAFCVFVMNIFGLWKKKKRLKIHVQVFYKEPPTHQLISPVPATARTGLCQSLEPGTQPGSSKCLARIQLPITCYLLACTLVGSWTRGWACTQTQALWYGKLDLKWHIIHCVKCPPLKDPIFLHFLWRQKERMRNREGFLLSGSLSKTNTQAFWTFP